MSHKITRITANITQNMSGGGIKNQNIDAQLRWNTSGNEGRDTQTSIVRTALFQMPCVMGASFDNHVKYAKKNRHRHTTKTIQGRLVLVVMPRVPSCGSRQEGLFHFKGVA
jgi:hypothetical protein